MGGHEKQTRGPESFLGIQALNPIHLDIAGGGSIACYRALGMNSTAVVRSGVVTTRRAGDFEWNEAKARVNLIKHGVTFEEALTAFADPLAIDAPDRYLPGRFVLIGNSARGRILFVVYEERLDSIRLISARKAAPIQRRKYEEGIDAS